MAIQSISDGQSDRKLVSSESGFRGVAQTNCFSSIFHFGQISKFKKGLIPRKKIESKISCGYAYLHIMSFITTKFHKILLSGFRGVALTNCVE